MKAIPFSLLFFFTALLVLAKDPYPQINGQDVLHYRYAIRLDSQTDEIQVQARILLRLSAPQSQIVMDLTGLKDQKGMIINHVQMGKLDIPYTHTGDKLRVDCPAYYGADTLINLTISYRGLPADGLIISENKYGNKSFFGDNWPDRARNWLVCADHPSDKATLEFLITAPDEYQVVANGFRKACYPVEAGYQLTHYQSLVPLPTKVMVIGVASFAQQTVGYAGNTPIETWVYPENSADGFLDYQPALEIVHFFNSKIGPYAFEKLANVQSKTVYGGMENSGAIFYYENSVTGKNQLHSLLAHEIAHQWFGDAVTEADWHHIWLSEGFATYFEAICMSEMHEEILLSDKMAASRDRVIRYFYRNPQPVIDTTIVDLRRLLSTNSYQKGAWVLHMLRKEVGEQAFWEGIQNYYALFQNRNALTDDFRHCMEKASGKHLGAFFEQWLERSGHPVLKIESAYDPLKKVVMIKLNQMQKGAPFTFDLELRLRSQDTDSEAFKIIQVNTQISEFEIPLEFNPEEIVLDPQVNLLFERFVDEKN